MPLRSISLRVTVLLTACLLASPASGQAIEEVQEAIDLENQTYMDAMAAPDARAFVEVFDEKGYRLVGGGEVIRGRRAILNQMGEFFTRVGPIDAILETADLWVVDSLAYETGSWSYTFTPPGDSRRTIGGRYVTIWKAQVDGGWKILADMGVPGTEE